MNNQVLYLSSNPDTEDLILQLIYVDTSDYRTGWSRYFKDYNTLGWVWDEVPDWTPTPIGVKGLIQW